MTEISRSENTGTVFLLQPLSSVTKDGAPPHKGDSRLESRGCTGEARLYNYFITFLQLTRYSMFNKSKLFTETPVKQVPTLTSTSHLIWNFEVSCILIATLWLAQIIKNLSGITHFLSFCCKWTFCAGMGQRIVWVTIPHSSSAGNAFRNSTECRLSVFTELSVYLKDFLINSNIS